MSPLLIITACLLCSGTLYALSCACLLVMTGEGQKVHWPNLLIRATSIMLPTVKLKTLNKRWMGGNPSLFLISQTIKLTEGGRAIQRIPRFSAENA